MTRPLVTVAQVYSNPIAYWLMASYAYDQLAVDIMADATFDKLGLFLHKNFAKVKHRHKYLIEGEHCHTTGSAITKPYEEWPLMVLSATHALLDDIHGKGWRSVDLTAYEKAMARLHEPQEGADLC